MKQSHINLILLLLYMVFSSCGTSKNTGKNIHLIFDDVTNFWNMYDKVKQIEDDTKRVEIIKKDYLKKATFGLKLLVFKDNLKALQYSNQLKDTVFYNSIRKTTSDIQADSVKIISYIHQFENIYPKATFNDIYFVVGQFYHGGTVILGKTIIEIQKNSKTKATKSAFLFSESQLNTLIEYNSFASLIIHEQVHVNQNKGLNTLFTNKLLVKTMSEGSADFVMFLITNQIPSHLRKTYAYGKEHEKELWLNFKKDLEADYGEIRKNWFYNYNQSKLPPDLGYFMGFKICEQYYNNSIGKEKAIEFILNGKNYTTLLSQYKDKN